MNRILTTFRPAHLIALVPIVAAFANLTQTSPLVSQPLGVLALVTLYVLVTALAGRLSLGLWTGYIALAVYVAWLTNGLGLSLLLVIAGAALAVPIYWFYIQQSLPSFEIVAEIVGRIAITGNGLLTAHFIFTSLGGHLPFTTPALDQIAALMMALLCGYVVMQALGMVISRISPLEHLQRIGQRVLLEALLVLVTLVLPLITVRIGAVPFAIMIGLTGAHAIRDYQVRHTQQSLMRRLREMGLLNSLGQTISTHLELDEVLQNIYREIRHLFDTSGFCIALYNTDHDTVEFPLAYDHGTLQEWPTRKLGHNSFSDYILRSRKAVFLPTLDPAELQAMGIDPQPLTAKAYIGVPLMVAEKVIGALVITQDKNPTTFTSSDVELLQTIASQASLALRNATLYNRTVNLARDLALINQSLQDVMFNLDRDNAMRTACQIAMQVTDAQKAAIFLLQPSRENRMELVQSVGFDNQAPFSHLPYQPLVYRDGPRMVTNVAESGDDLLQHQAEAGHFKALVQVPLRSGNTVIGCLCVYHDKEHFYEKPELNLLEMLANQITAALDNADLLQALELYAAEQAQLVHLSRISTSNLDLERIIYDVCNLLAQMMDMARIEIALHFPEYNVLRIFTPMAGATRLEVQEMRLTHIPEFNAILHIDSLAALRVYYASEPEYSTALQAYFMLRQDETIALIPMRINQQSIGLIVLADTNHRFFNDNDYRLLEMATHQVAAQVHNARIHTLTEEALVRRLEQLSLIEEIAQQISQSLDSNLLIDHVLDAALQVSQAEFAAVALRNPARRNYFDIILKERIADHVMRRTLTMKIEHGIVGHIASTRETLVVGDIRALDIYQPLPDIAHQYRSLLAVPLLKGDEVLGILDIESTRVNFFTAEQVSFIKSLAGHAAISLDNADLLDRQERQINTLTQLRGLSLETLSMLELGRVARAIVETALIILEGNASALYLYDSAPDSLELVEGAIAADSTIHFAKPVIPPGVILEAAHLGSVQFIPDTNENRFYQDYPQPVNHRSALVIPIKRRQMVREVLCVTFEQPRLIAANDLNAIDLLAVQVAGHLENAALNEVIRNSNGRMRAILNATRDGIILLDRHGRIQDANTASETLLKLGLRQHLDTPFVNIARNQGEQSEALRAIAATYEKDPNSLNDWQFELPNGDDKPVVIRIAVTPVNDEEHNVLGHLLVLRDITNEKELQDFREAIQSYVLHDVRGPLAAIISNFYLAINMVEFPDDRPFENTLLPTLRVSLDSANKLLKLVDTLKDLPMIAQMELNPEPLVLQDIAATAYDSLAAFMKQANISIEYDIPADGAIYVDSDLIRRVFVNLLHNAFKFTPDHGQILISAEPFAEAEDFLCVRVSDSGPGIPEDERERIFEQFVQIEGRKPRPTGKGLGLGLNFCKMAVEAHGGHIWVEADGPLSGACFAFTLPRKALDKANGTRAE